MKTSIITQAGAAVDLLNITPADIDFAAISESLAKICRWTGNTTHFYSVAQHCVAVANELPIELQAYGLLHDAHEAFIGDISTPVAAALRAMGAADALDRLKAKIDVAIYAAAGLTQPLSSGDRWKIERADHRVLATERRDLVPALLPGQPDIFGAEYEPVGRRLVPMPWPTAAATWFGRLEALGITTRRNQVVAQSRRERGASQ